MTLEEAIERSIRIAEKNEELHKTTHPAFRLFDYEKCAKDSRQLAEWLFELKDLREQKDIMQKIISNDERIFESNNQIIELLEAKIHLLTQRLDNKI